MLSPHYDDAVLSCAHHMMKWRREGKRILVVSVFTKNQRDREEENRKALDVLGIEGLSLGYPDAPDRFVDPISYSRIVSWPIEEALLDRLSQDIQGLVSRYEPELVIGPMGLGFHVDHRLTFEAFNRVQFVEKLLYEDKPYSVVPEHLELLMGPKPALSEEFWERYFSYGYINSFCRSQNERELVKRVIERRKNDKQICISKKSESLESFGQLDRAIRCYRSQFELLFPFESEYKALYSEPESLWLLE